MHTSPYKSSKAIPPSVKTIEVNLVVSCGLASPATRPSRQTKTTGGSLALPPGQADPNTTETTARPTLATQGGGQLCAIQFYAFARLGIWTIWNGLGIWGLAWPQSLCCFCPACFSWPWYLWLGLALVSATTRMVFVAWLCLGLCLLFVWLGGRGGPRTQPDNTKRFTFGWLGGQTIEVNLVASCGLASPATRPSRQTKTTETTARPTHRALLLFALLGSAGGCCASGRPHPNQ